MEHWKNILNSKMPDLMRFKKLSKRTIIIPLQAGVENSVENFSGSGYFTTKLNHYLVAH